MTDNDADYGRCIVCRRLHYRDPDIESFCSGGCEDAYRLACRDAAEGRHDVGEDWGPEDTPSLEDPWWRGR